MAHSQARKSAFKNSKISVQKVWTIFFCVWLLLLTGLFDFWVGSPGLKQWYRVHHLLSERRQEIGEIEARSAHLRHVAKELETNSVALDREIRKVLGYLGPNEVVFEFISKN